MSEELLIDGYYMWTPSEPVGEIGARPVEVYRGDMYALDTQTKVNKLWCLSRGALAPMVVVPEEVREAIGHCWRWALIYAEKGSNLEAERRQYMEHQASKVCEWLQQQGGATP